MNRSSAKLRKRYSHEQARNQIHVVRSSHSTGDKRYLFWFGRSSPRYVLAYGRGIYDALEEAVDYVANHWPGRLDTAYVNEEYKRLRAAGKSEDDAIEEAEMDMSLFDGGHYISVEEYGIVAENPSRAQLLEVQDRPAEHRAKGKDALRGRELAKRRGRSGFVGGLRI